MSVELRVKEELEYYNDNMIKIEEFDPSVFALHKPILYTGRNVQHIRETLRHMSDSPHWFCLNDYTMFIIPLSMAPSRLKNENGEWYMPHL
jgi:hypothetical protein